MGSFCSTCVNSSDIDTNNQRVIPETQDVFTSTTQLNIKSQQALQKPQNSIPRYVNSNFMVQTSPSAPNRPIKNIENSLSNTGSVIFIQNPQNTLKSISNQNLTQNTMCSSLTKRVNTSQMILIKSTHSEIQSQKQEQEEEQVRTLTSILKEARSKNKQ